MKAELDREFQRTEEDESQLLPETPLAEAPARAAGNGASRRAHAEKTGHSSHRKWYPRCRHTD